MKYFFSLTNTTMNHQVMAFSGADFNPNLSADLTIGIILILCTLIGLPANITAFSYFFRRKSRNENSQFFTRMYCVISLVDCLISCKHVPVIQSMFNHRGNTKGDNTTGEETTGNLFFNNKHFCNVWFMITMCTITVSIICVLILALSRYILLKYPNSKLSGTPPWAVPFTWTTLLVAAMCGLIAAEYVAVAFNMDKGVCVMYGSVPGFDFRDIKNTTVMSKQMMQNDMTKKIVWSCIMAAPLPFILIFFALSLRHLKMARVRAMNSNVGHKAHSSASITVVAVTLAYAVCNLPMIGYLIYLKYHIADIISDWDDFVTKKGDGDEVGYLVYKDHLYEDVYSEFERYYAWVCVFDVPTALNSMINPMIYYWRMKPFRRYIHSQILEMTSSHTDQQTRSDKTNRKHNSNVRSRMSLAWRDFRSGGGCQNSKMEESVIIHPITQSRNISANQEEIINESIVVVNSNI